MKGGNARWVQTALDANVDLSGTDQEAIALLRPYVRDFLRADEETLAGLITEALMRMRQRIFAEFMTNANDPHMQLVRATMNEIIEEELDFNKRELLDVIERRRHKVPT